MKIFEIWSKKGVVFPKEQYNRDKIMVKAKDETDARRVFNKNFPNGEVSEVSYYFRGSKKEAEKRYKNSSFGGWFE